MTYSNVQCATNLELKLMMHLVNCFHLISDAPTCASKMDDQLIGVTSEEAISINCRVSPKVTKKVWKTFPCPTEQSPPILTSCAAAEFYCYNLIEVMASAECSMERFRPMFQENLLLGSDFWPGLMLAIYNQTIIADNSTFKGRKCEQFSFQTEKLLCFVQRISKMTSTFC